MEPPSNNQQLKHPRSKPRAKCITSDTYYANVKLVPIPDSNGKYKLDITKIEEEELMILPPEEKDSRLFGWKVEIRQRSNGRHHDKFYSHIQNGFKFRSAPEVITYVLFGKQKNESGKKPGRPAKRNRNEEDEVANTTDSHPAENEKDKSLSEGSPREALQPLQLDRSSFCAHLNEAVKNEWSSLITSLPGGNGGKGISIQEPAGLESKVVSSGKLNVEGKGKGILIEENDVERSVFGIHGGMLSSQLYTCADFQTPTIMQAGWSSMEGDAGRMCMAAGSWNNSLDMDIMGMNGTTFGSSNLNVLANVQNDNQVPAPCTNTLPGNIIADPCRTSAMQSIDETNGQPLSANLVDAKNGEKDPLNSIVITGGDTSENPVNMDMDTESFFEGMPTQAEMDGLMSFIYSDFEEKKQEEVEEDKEEEADAVQDNEADLTKTYDDIMDDEPIVDSFYEKYWRDKQP